MSLRLWLRSLEQRCLRPLGRLARRSAAARPPSRIERLERRVEELEDLVRELTGLAWLRLDEGREAGPDGAAREAA